MGCAGLWVVGGLPQSDRASRFPVLLPPPCWPGNAKSKEARHCSRAGKCKGRRHLQEPNSQLSRPLFSPPNCHLIACARSLSEGYFSRPKELSVFHPGPQHSPPGLGSAADLWQSHDPAHASHPFPGSALMRRDSELGSRTAASLMQPESSDQRGAAVLRMGRKTEMGDGWKRQ